MKIIRLIYKEIRLRKQQREQDDDMAYFRHRMRIGFGLKSSYKFKNNE
jgi:hypothetical protein